MSLTLTETPRRTVNGIDSNVIAAKAQIPLKFLRQDYNRSIVGRGVNFSTDFEHPDNPQVGDLWFLDFQGSGDNENGVFPVTSVSEPPGFVQLQFGTLPNTAGGFIILNELTGRANYVVSLTVTNTATGLPILPAPLNFKPFSDGNLFVDLHDIFFGFDFFGQSLQFTVEFQEIWTGEGGDDGDSGVTPEIVGLSGYKQLQQDGGSNMWEFLPTKQDTIQTNRFQPGTQGVSFRVDPGTGDLSQYAIGDFVKIDNAAYPKTMQVQFVNNGPFFTIDTLEPFVGQIEAGAGLFLATVSKAGGRFLTTLKRGTHWLYSRRTISFVIDSELLARTGSATLDFVLTGLDAAGGTIFFESTPFSGQGLKVVEFPIAEEVATWEVVLLVGLASEVGSERLVFDQQKECTNPIMLEWENREGAPEQHQFAINQAIQTINPEGLVFEQPILNTLDLITAAVGRVPLGETQLITLTAEELTIDQLKSLRFMKESGHVALFLDRSGSKQISVAIVENLITPYETRAGLYSFTCIIRLPKNFEFESII